MTDIRQEEVIHFTEIFREPNLDKSRLHGTIFCSLSVNDNLSLSDPFSL